MAESSRSVYSPTRRIDTPPDGTTEASKEDRLDKEVAVNGDVVKEDPEPQSFMRTQALSHDDTFLSPRHAAHFDVDKFLVSRATGSTLNEIAAELQLFGGKLRHELDEVVDRDFRGFVNLGVALKAERPRIARLDWRGTEVVDRDTEEQTSSSRSVKSNGSGANLGLAKVRNELVDVRDALREDEQRIRSTMLERQRNEEAHASMQVLVTFNESLCRLESMLLSSDSQKESELADDVNIHEDQKTFWDAFDLSTSEAKAEEDDSRSLSSSSDYETHNAVNGYRDNTADGNKTAPTKMLNRRASNSTANKNRRRSSLALLSTNMMVQTHATGPSLTLPERIQRASSEYSAFVFLSDQARSAGFSGFLDAHASRVIAIQTALRQNIANLLRALTRYGGPSMLIPGLKETTADIADLGRWSKYQDGGPEERKAEQVAWLRLALSTWSLLPPTSATDVSEIEDEIRSSLVEPWCDAHISSSALQNGTTLMYAGQTDVAEDANIQISDELSFAEGQRNAIGAALIQLYNSILAFVEQQTSSVCLIAEEVLASSDSDESESGRCDVYVRSVWREIATRLMERIGGQLFFVGRPDDFRINYTISLAFLDAFERLAPSQRAARALQQDVVYVTFKKRWQLSVYFQMRFRDTVTKFEATVQATPNELDPGAVSPITVAALDAFVSPWTAKSHVDDLSHRQWRLSLQIVSRYKTWIQTMLPNEILPAHRRVTEAGRTQSPASSFEQQRYGNTQSMTNSPVRAGTPTANDVDHENALMEVCTSLAGEALRFEADAFAAFEDTIVAALRRGIEPDDHFDAFKSDLRNALEASLQSVSAQVVPLCASKVTAILKSRSAEPLRLVRSVSTQYRTSGSSQTVAAGANGAQARYEPSFFVAQFLRPVRHYLGAVDNAQQRSTDTQAKPSARLPKDTREQWIGEVIEDFVVRYTASLTTMSKNFESLQRLKRVNAVGGAADGQPAGTGKTQSQQGPSSSLSESDRMYAQMIADVDHFERSVQDLGAEVDTQIPTQTPAWRRLKAASRGEELED